MNTPQTTMSRFFLFTASFVLAAGMVFGIGLSSAKAILPIEATEAQPATGAEMYKAVESGNAEIVTSDHEEEANTATKDHAKENSSEDAGIVGMFGLNWKLFLAQLINFGIILLVLWKWVFGPVTKGLADRTKKIETSLQDAKEIAKDRETFDTWKQGEIGAVRTEASAIITKAKKEAETLKQTTLEQTKQDQEKLITNVRAKLEQERQAMLKSVKNELAELVMNATSAVLKQKLDPKKDATLIEEALKQASASNEGGGN